MNRISSAVNAAATRIGYNFSELLMDLWISRIIAKDEYDEGEGFVSMRRWVMIFCIMAIMSLLCFGCAWTTKESSKSTGIRCPKCAAFFSSKEGAETFEWMRGEVKDTRR